MLPFDGEIRLLKASSRHTV